MNIPLISIIVPVYKAEPFLRKCVDSILAQTYSNIEVILVDDGSPDGCPAICDEYAAKDSRVVVLHQENAGVSAARNAALDVAKGDFIGFVDSDDWIEPDVYEVLYDVMVASQSDISVLNFCGDADVPEETDAGAYVIFSKTEAIKRVLHDQVSLTTVWGKLFNIKVFENVHFPSGITNGEDTVVTLKAIANSNNVAYIDYKGYHYVFNPHSAVHAFRDSFWSLQDACERIIDAVKDENDEILGCAEASSIKGDITIAIHAADSGVFSQSAYQRVVSHIEQHKKGKPFLPFYYRFWLFFLSLGRRPFVVVRKVFISVWKSLVSVWNEINLARKA